MPTPSGSKLPAIKLKLNLGGAGGSGGVAAAAETTPSSGKKGKSKGKEKVVERVAHQDELPHTPTPKSGQAVPASKGIKVKLQPNGDVASPALPTGITEAAGPSTPSEPSPRPSTPLASTPLTAFKRKSAKAQAKSRASLSQPPSAIPPRLLSADPSTPRPSSSTLPSTPGSSTYTPAPIYSPAQQDGDDTSIKMEPPDEAVGDDDVDPLSLPLSPQAADVGTPRPEYDTPSASGGRGRTGGRWMRLKRPLKELLGKIMSELRKKDEYALFGEPVNLEAFPDYLSIVGGEDKMMDLGTMQSKVDAGEYTVLDEVEADLRTLVTAATTFNPPSTIPHTSANRLLTHGLKHIDRARPLVLTPTPSPERNRFSTSNNTPWRELSAMDDYHQNLSSLQPAQTIPEEMLVFPPNSLEALAVGWNLTGGRRVYAKRDLRARERFAGKWRHWGLDGARELSEMEDPAEVFMLQRDKWRAGREVVDWKGLRKEEWWDWGGFGGQTGMPPVPFASFPQPQAVRHRELGPLEWGVYPEVEAELAFLASRVGGAGGEEEMRELLAEHVRPLQTRGGWRSTNAQDVYADEMSRVGRGAGEWLREVVLGGSVGEAYERSVRSFIHGAKAYAEDGEELEKRVQEYHHSDLQPDDGVARTTIEKMQHRPLDGSIRTLAERAHARIALRQVTAPTNPLDIRPFLRDPKDFLVEGRVKELGIGEAMKWVGEEIARVAQQRVPVEVKLEDGKMEQVGGEAGVGVLKRKRELVDGGSAGQGQGNKKVKVEPEPGSTTSSPLSSPPSSPLPLPLPPSPPPAADDEAMTRLRLELAALSKFYPLAALRKMTKDEAERFLPPHVRGLMIEGGGQPQPSQGQAAKK